MAQVTTLHPNGVMGPTYSFVAKGPATDPLTATFCVAKTDAFVAGAVIGQGFETGAAIGDGFEEGAVVGDGC